MPYGNLLADVVQGSTANTPPVFKDGNGTTIGTLCRAWVNFNGTGTVAIRASFNVSSITDNGTGDYTINFTNAMPDANYGYVTGSTEFSGATGNNDVVSYDPSTILTTSIRVRSRQAATALDMPVVCVSIFR
jgi:hypothetical protein